MRVRILFIVTGFWFTLIWTFRWNVPPQFDLREVVLVEGEVSNYFGFILDPFLQLL